MHRLAFCTLSATAALSLRLSVQNVLTREVRLHDPHLVLPAAAFLCRGGGDFGICYCAFQKERDSWVSFSRGLAMVNVQKHVSKPKHLRVRSTRGWLPGLRKGKNKTPNSKRSARQTTCLPVRRLRTVIMRFVHYPNRSGIAARLDKVRVVNHAAGLDCVTVCKVAACHVARRKQQAHDCKDEGGPKNLCHHVNFCLTTSSPATRLGRLRSSGSSACRAVRCNPLFGERSPHDLTGDICVSWAVLQVANDLNRVARKQIPVIVRKCE